MRWLRYFSQANSPNLPSFRVAIVGSGPAGFYTAHHLIHKSLGKFNVKVDFFDRLAAPFGLSRYGVAPDHPEVKNCEDYMNNLLKLNDVRFFGNVDIGKDVSLKTLNDNYHSVVLSYGCVNSDNKLNVPGAQLKGVISACQFVNWYNGHPDFHGNHYTPPPLDKITNVSIIGNGNVALDVARVLLADPQLHWSPTDISVEAVEVLKKSTVKNVNIIARRGIPESAFTNKELRELLELNDTKKVKFIPVDTKAFDAFTPYIKKLDRVNKRRVSLLEKYSTPDNYEPEKTWSLQYFKSPSEFVVNDKDPNLLLKTIFKQTKVEANQNNDGYRIVLDPESEPVEIDNELVILSIGYKGMALNEFSQNNILFSDEQNRIVNKGGRIIASETSDPKNPIYKPGFYTSGWIKNGPKGVIASTMMDSFDTAENLIFDLSSNIHTNSKSYELEDTLKNLQVVNWNGWQKINDYEIEEGTKLGKTRNKVSNQEQMIEIANK